MTLTQELITNILEMSTDFYDNPNGPYEERCPYCDNYKTYQGNENIPTMDDISHDVNCAWILAKKLQQEEYPEMLLWKVGLSIM